jgi:hypothetical protein
LQIDEVNNGNMKRPEAILLAQAHTLDELFNNLARRAHKVQSLKQYEMDLRLALKAQSQCRATLETLAAIKNPPVIFAKQANISNGHQQINNGVQSTHAEKTKNQPNELCVRQNMAARQWTLEQRAKQAAKIKQWQPWNNSTGAKTPEGKARSSRNAFKGGIHAFLKETTKLLREQKDCLQRIK